MEKRKEIIDNLIKSYWMEIETVINYISNSINLDGVDYVTQDLCIRLLGMEESHRIEFVGFLKEYK